jgi:hypothetical protein
VPGATSAPPLAYDSIRGGRRLRAEARAGARFGGRVDGVFERAPKPLAAAGLRQNAACRFHSEGELRGAFEFDRATGRFVTLRVAGKDVEQEWLLRFPGGKTDFAPRHAVALEWVEAASAVETRIETGINPEARSEARSEPKSEPKSDNENENEAPR